MPPLPQSCQPETEDHLWCPLALPSIQAWASPADFQNPSCPSTLSTRWVGLVFPWMNFHRGFTTHLNYCKVASDHGLFTAFSIPWQECSCLCTSANVPQVVLDVVLCNKLGLIRLGIFHLSPARAHDRCSINIRMNIFIDQNLMKEKAVVSQ